MLGDQLLDERNDGHLAPAPRRRSSISLWRMVRYFVRNGLLRWAALATVAAEVAVAMQRGMQWRGDIVWTIDWIPVSFMIVGPVVSGLAAIDTAHSAHGAGHLFRGRVTRTPAFAITAAYAVVIGAVHLVVVATALAVSAPRVWDPWAGAAVLVQLAMLAFFAAIGTTLGRFAGVVMAGALGALSAFGLLFVASAPGDGVVLLEFGGATLPRVGYAYSPAYLGAQLLLLVVSIAGLLVLRPLDPLDRPRPARRDAVLAGTAVAAVIAGSLVVPSERLVPVKAAPTLCGAVQMVPTCFYPQHERVMRAFQDRMWVLVSAARENGYGDLVPRRILEASRTELPAAAGDGTAAFYVMPDHLQGKEPTSWEIVSGIVQPLHCAQVRQEQPPSDRYWQDLESLVVTWVSLAEPGIIDEVAYEGAILTPDEASTLSEELRRCTYVHF